MLWCHFVGLQICIDIAVLSSYELLYELTCINWDVVSLWKNRIYQEQNRSKQNLKSHASCLIDVSAILL